MKYLNGYKKSKKLNKILSTLSIFIMFCLFTFSISNLALAAKNLSNTDESINGIATSAGYKTDASDPYTIIGNLIKVALSFLGVLFLILVIISGFQWMMAEGNEDAVKKAKSRIKNATIGLAIVVLAYSLTYFILDILLSQTIK